MKSQWEYFEDGDYFNAGFEPSALEVFKPLHDSFTRMAGEGHRITAGVVANHMNVAFADSVVPQIKTEKDFKIMVGAFIDLEADMDPSGPR